MSPITHMPNSPRLRRAGQLGAALGLAALLAVLIRPVIADTTGTGLDIPDSPLITDAQVAPNILFVLDDSSSMTYDYMPDSVPKVGTTSAGSGTLSCSGNTNSTSTTYIGCSAYPRNTVYYNPLTTYQPWTLPDGTLMTGGTSYGSAYSNTMYVPYSATGPAGNGTVTTTSSTTDLASSIQTFYVPKDTGSTDADTYLATGSNYYRYQILTDGTIWRSEYVSYTSSNTPTATTGTLATTVSANSGSYLPSSGGYTITVPSGVTTLTISTSSTSNCSNNSRCADLYVKSGSAPTTSSYDYRSVSNGNTESVSISSPTAGTWYVRLYAQSTFSNVTVGYTYTVSHGCDTTTSGYGWRNCTQTTPTGRTEAAERSNFATWYSYNRTRNKAAKSGASQAFAEMGDDVRVGFRTIWGRTACGGSSSGNCTYSYSSTYNMPTQDIPIPVNYNDGRFSDTGSTSNSNAFNNRTQWYNRLFTASASSSTPLRSALANAGSYFSSSSATGPYGPESSTDQYVCRQNFTILTTDGYWNEDYSSGTIGNADNTAGSTITSSTGSTYTYSPADPYSDSYSSMLADVAMYYWKNDLRTDLDNAVPTSSDDPAFWQHMTTFSLSLGMSGTVDQSSVDEVLALGYATVNGVKGWPKPVNNTSTTIDDLLHAAVNGHGAFVAASNPSEFTSGLTSALAAISQRTGSFSNVTAESASVSSDNYLFAASYISGVWTGQLMACASDEDSCSSSAAVWTATSTLSGITASTRSVYTYESGAGATFPTTTQKTALGGSDVTDYLRGDQSNEIQNGGTLRNRSTVLGDIVDSSPTYVSATDTVYVGANDGMLHAFDAASGKELFAYVPGGIDTDDLASYADSDYSHRYFVDGPITVSTRAQTTSQNILVGALGRGGKGLYALDVTSPSTFSSSKVLWEATETTNKNMGKILGQPFIAKLNSGVTALVTGNGVNSASGHAVLLVYNLSTGALIKEIDTGVGGATAATTNGLFAPTGWDEDSSGTVDYVYAGDLQGNVWKFDLSASASASWSVDNGGEPLFTATDASGAAQPITGGMLLAEKTSTGDTWVFFGTGKYLESDDIEDTSLQTLYGIIDEGSTTARSELTARTITSTTSSSTGETVRAFESNTALPSGSKGWYVNLAVGGVEEGERIISTPLSYGSYLVVSSIIPSGDGCQSNGTGWVYALDMFTGTSGSDSYFDLDGDGSTSDETTKAGSAVGGVSISSGMASVAALMNGKLAVGDSSGTTTSISTATVGNSRVSWREVLKEN